MSEAENARWYVVHTYSGYENKVKADIENKRKQEFAGSDHRSSCSC